MRNRYLGKSKLAFTPTKMEPKVLYKQSDLKKDFRTGEIRLISVCFTEDEAGTSVNADAKCLAHMNPLQLSLGPKTWTLDTGGPVSHRETPARRCRCGFHAYNEYSPARNHDQKGDFILKVVGSGKMFEYKQGYRYGHQRLEEVIVTKCGTCKNYADRLLVRSQGKVMPLCASCFTSLIRKVEKVMSFSEFEEAASKGLPPNAPRITIRSELASLAPWERPAQSPEKDQTATKRTSKKRPSWMNSENVAVALMCSPVAIPLIMLVQYYNAAMNQ